MSRSKRCEHCTRNENARLKDENRRSYKSTSACSNTSNCSK